VQLALTTEAQGTKSQQYNCFIILKGSASKRTCPHTHTHISALSAHNSKTVLDYFIPNRKLSELFLDVRVYRGGGTGSDHFLTFAKLRFTPKLLYLTKNTACEENILHYTISLTRWWKYSMFIQTRIQQKLQEIPEISSIVLGMEEHQNYNLTGSR